MKKQNEESLREDIRLSFKQGTNPDIVISVILKLLIKGKTSTSELRNTFFIVKEELISYFFDKELLAEMLFKRMWWHGNPLLMQMSTYLIHIFFKPKSSQDLTRIIPYFRQLSSLQSTQFLGFNIAHILERHNTLAVFLIARLARSSNKWERLLAIHIIKELKTKADKSMDINKQVENLKKDNDKLVRKYANTRLQPGEDLLHSMNFSLPIKNASLN